MSLVRLLLCAFILYGAALRLAPVSAETEDYKALTEAAVEEHALGHYEEARALFAKAHAINPNARTLWGMGTAAFEARQYVDAIQLFEAALADTRKPLTTEQRKRAESLLKRSADFVVKLRIELRPSNASLSFDGRTAEPDAQGVVLLDAGAHQIVASAAGYRESVRSMRWEAGEATLYLQLEREDRPEPELPVRASNAPLSQAPADNPTPGPNTLGALKWVSLGTTVAALGVAAGGYGLHERAAKAWNDEEHCPPDKAASCPDIRDAANRGKIMGIAGAASAGLFAVLTTVFFILDGPKRPPAQRASTMCLPQALGTGVVCNVRY
jgi:tetratricopeptide (TPR) repeat protein